MSTNMSANLPETVVRAGSFFTQSSDNNVSAVAKVTRGAAALLSNVEKIGAFSPKSENVEAQRVLRNLVQQLSNTNQNMVVADAKAAKAESNENSESLGSFSRK